MARAQQRPRRLLGFAVLVIVVITSGVILASQGDLISPIQSTTMLISMASGDDSFAMVGDRSEPPNDAEASTETTVLTAEQPEAAAVDAESGVTETTSEGTMTLEEFTTELAAAGVDVESVSTTMSAEGRSLENLLAVVNSGRTSVAELAARLSGETTDATSTEGAQPPSGESSTSLIDFRWDEIGSVAYNLWVMLAATAAVIVIARPAGWIVNRIKRSPRTMLS